MKSFLLAVSSLALLCCLFLSASAEPGGWKVLFDGTSTDAWRGYRSDAFPEGGWKIEDGVLTSIGGGDRTDIVTREAYTDFELELEWRVEPRGNSGIFYRVSEEPEIIWHAAPEIQIIDDRGGSHSKQSAGSLYDLLPPNDRKNLRPAGEFNSVRLIHRGNDVEHWLNGDKILSYNLDDPKLQEKIAQSKFAQFEQFARTEKGLVALQHHGDTVGFRNIRIRELPPRERD